MTWGREVSCWLIFPNFSLSSVTVPEVFAKVNSTGFVFWFIAWVKEYLDIAQQIPIAFVFVFAGFMYDSLKTFKPVFYLAAGPMICGSFLLFVASFFKWNQASRGCEELIGVEPISKRGNRVEFRIDAPPVIVLTEPEENPLVVVERLTVLWPFFFVAWVERVNFNPTFLPW